MAASSPKPHPEQHETVQDQFAAALKRYSGVSRAVIEQRDVPAKGRLLLAVLCTTVTGIVLLGASRAQTEAYCFLLVCSLIFGLLINGIKDTPGEIRDKWTRPPKPRPRRGH